MSRILRLAVLLPWLYWSAAIAQAQSIAGKGPQLLQNGTFSKHPEVSTTAYTIAANTDLGNWTSGLVYSNTDVQPLTTAPGVVAIQIGTSSTTAVSQVPFPGDAANGIPAASTWLYVRGNQPATGAGALTFWQQNVAVRPSTTYTFACYVSNANNPGSTDTSTPILQFLIGGAQVGTSRTIANETTAGGDVWTRYSVSYTTSASQTALALALVDAQTGTGTGNQLAVSAISFRADNPGAVNSRYSCDGKFYQIRQVVTTTAPITNSTRLFNVDRSTGNAYTTVEQSDLGATLNCLGYRPGDGLQYALTYVSNSVNSATVGADRVDEYNDPMELYAIDKNGDIRSLGVVSGLPGNQWAGGVIDRAGYYYVVSQNFNTTANPTLIYRIDLNNIEKGLAPTAEKMTLSGMPNSTNSGAASYAIFDIAFNPKDGNLYGVDYLNRFYRIVVSGTTATATLVNFNTTQTISAANALGTCFFDIAGSLYVYRNGTIGTTNSGQFYIVNTSTAEATSLSNIQPAANSDGASCVTPDQSVDVVKEVVSIAPTGTANQYAVGFRLQVRNNGSITDPNVQVSDLLWAGSTTANAGTTFSGASAVAISKLVVTPTGGSTVAANTSFTGQSGAAGLLTGNQPLAAGQGAAITFTATVTFPTGAVPTTPQNNTAYATSSNTSSTGYTLQGASPVPPTDLVAQDASTNSGALPETANADAASPSPIYYNTAILGNIFEDSNYGGGAGRSQGISGGNGVNGARVELYSVSTTGGVDTYTYLNATTTDAAGNYVFTTTNGTTTLSASTTYAVRVVNNSVLSNRAGSTGGLLPVQTFRTDATTATTTDVTDRVGGEQPKEEDYGNVTSGTLPASAASTTQEVQSLTKVLTPASGPRVGIDFGFNFSTIVNTNNAGQGSLRQFIVNSNTLGGEAQLIQAGSNAAGLLPAGKETSIFMIPDGNAHGGQRSGLSSGLTSGVAVITPTAALPAISGNNTRLDGTTQTVNVGNTNAATLGTGGTVGTAATTFGKVNGPEVQITQATNLAGLSITGSDVALTGVALYGSNGSALTISGNNASISNNVLGATALSFADPTAAARTPNSQINVTAGSGTSITGNLIGYAGQSGVTLASAVTNVSITGNEVRSNGLTSATADGLTLNANVVSVLNNLIAGNAGMGIDMGTSTGTTTITGNTISDNGRGTTTLAPAETAGVRVVGAANRLSNNVISNNYGAGIMVASGVTTTGISQNSTSGNGSVTAANGTAATGQLGIDLLTSTDNADKGTSAYASLNATGKSATSGANGLLNFPVITQTVITNTTNGELQVTGFAPAGSVVELFVADVAGTTATFGQGKTYIATRTEGNSTDDTGTGTGSYSGTVNGLNQGSETNAARFLFRIPLTDLTAAQRSALTATNARLTATATTVSNTSYTTSEFSGTVLIKPNAPLPVELTAFEVKAAKTDALLIWSTASEKNNDHFEVERSFDGLAFALVGQVAGHGSTSQAHDYRLTDSGAGARYQGAVYYRIKQVDTDGTTHYSPVRTVTFAAEIAAGVTLYPNPATTTTTLDLTTLPAGSYQVTLLDMTGRSMLTSSLAGGLQHALAIDALPQGNYLVIVRGTNATYTVRLVKK